MKDFTIAILELENILEKYDITPLDKFKIIQTIEVLKRLDNGESTQLH
jgi:hypothetical protein